jgi:hypothetical protein
MAEKKSNETDKLSLKEKLMHIQTELQVRKEQFNSYGNFSYRSIDDIYAGVREYLIKYKCILIISDVLETVGSCVYVRSDISLADAESDDIITVSGYAKESEHGKMTGDQWTGSASSYARKYALTGLFLLGDEPKPPPGITGSRNSRKAETAPPYICETCGVKIQIPKGWTAEKMAAYYKRDNGGKFECKKCMEKKK